jgi:DNA-binding transcriptional ArsR family regulator
MPQSNKLAVECVVDDLEVLKVIAHSTRLDILQSLKLPKTVKDIAKKLKLPATKLYYHVNLMEKHGLIQVVETNIVSGIVEKKYQVVARNYRIDNQLLANQPAVAEDLARMLNAIFDITRTEILRLVAQSKHNPFKQEDESGGILWRSNLRLTPDQYKTFYGRINAILDEMTALQSEVTEEDTAVPNQNLYGLTIAYYPVVTAAEADE